MQSPSAFPKKIEASVQQQNVLDEVNEDDFDYDFDDDYAEEFPDEWESMNTFTPDIPLPAGSDDDVAELNEQE